MVTSGRVKNGVVVLEPGIRLPEGLEVTVLAPVAASETPTSRPHCVLDIPPVSLGPVLATLTSDDDLLSEMLEGRP